MARVIEFDLSRRSVRELNQFLHHELPAGERRVEVLNPSGLHSLAVGLDAPVEIDIRGRRVAAKVAPMPFYKRTT